MGTASRKGLALIPALCIICDKAVESRKMKVNKALLLFCEAHFLPFPPQSSSRAFLLGEYYET